MPIDVHLMIQPVDALAASFAQAGADYISFHPDASPHVHRSIQAIKAAGCKAGLVFNPGLGLEALDWAIDDIDLILIMSVNPGFGGQSFIDSAQRLPHENDQTAENQDTPDGQPTAEGKQAHKDVESGQVDTDRGAVTDRVYNDKLKK